MCIVMDLRETALVSQVNLRLHTILPTRNTLARQKPVLHEAAAVTDFGCYAPLVAQADVC